MNCELLSNMLSALIGGLLALMGSMAAARCEYRAQRKQEWQSKQYDLFCEVVGLLMRLAEFSKNADAPLPEAKEVNPVSSDCLWSEIAALRDKIIPRISILFDLEMEERISSLAPDGREDQKRRPCQCDQVRGRQ